MQRPKPLFTESFFRCPFIGDNFEGIFRLDTATGAPVSLTELDDIPVDKSFQIETSKEKNPVHIVPDRFTQSLIEVKEPKPFKRVNVHKTYTTQERIEQVTNGTYIHLCLAANSQDYETVVVDFQNFNGLYEATIRNNYKKLDNGSLEMVNQYLLKKQKQVLGYLIKQFGSVLMSGKSIMTVSLPITIFEPRSLLERLADSFAFAPHFLEKGGSTTDIYEQFKLAFAFYLTTLGTDLCPEKPFNPIIGETFQAVIGGCPVYLEQISHHPPVAAFQMFGKNFKIEGTFEFGAAINANSVKCRKIGDFRVYFKNTGAMVQALFPTGVMSGTAFGKRSYSYTKKLQVYDLKNNYYGEIDFDKSEPGCKKKEMPGYFSNQLYKISDKFSQKMKQELQKQKDAEIKFKEKDHSAGKLEKIEGSWYESLYIDDKAYWGPANPWPHKLQHVDNPLPSDANFRMDLLHLKAGDEIKAQEAKVAFEEFQRKDRKLREQTKSKRYK